MKTTLVLHQLWCMAALAASNPGSEMDQFMEELNPTIPSIEWIKRRDFDSFEQMGTMLGGTFPDPNYGKHRTFDEDYFRAALTYDPPKSFDARTKWANCKSISHIWDQRCCGSCWAVSAASAISDRICIHTGEQVMVSAQQILSCVNSSGCEGGGITSDAWHYWADRGLVSGADTCGVPYTIPKCKYANGRKVDVTIKECKFIFLLKNLSFTELCLQANHTTFCKFMR